MKNITPVKTAVFFVSIVCFLSGCPGGILYDGEAPSDGCFNGLFNDALQGVSIHVVHNGGVVAASGWKEPEASVPWNYFYFNGNITRTREARGEMTLYFPEFIELRIPDVILSLPNDRACNLRNSLIFYLAYTWEGRAYRENYNFSRQPS